MKRRLFIAVMTVVATLCLCLGLAACSTKNPDDGAEHQHTLDHTGAVAATCTEEGNVEYWHCSDCGKYFSDNTGTTEITVITIPATGHTWDDGEVTTEPTCTTAGVKTYTCTVCSETKTEAISAGHTWDDGEITEEATCTEEGEITYTCTVCSETRTEAIPATGHTPVSANNGVAATCTTAGKESDTVCSVCHETLTEGATIPATGHTPVSANNGVAATCTTTGKESDMVCSVCHETLTEGATIPATGHTPVSANNGVAATCTTAGKESDTVCSVCHETLTTGAEIPATGHNYVNGVCTVCGAENVSENLAYTLSSDGTYYTVSGIGDCTDTEIVIPATYNSLPVTAIAADAFENQTQITSVSVPGSVTSIGSAAFSGCSGLTSITLPFAGGSAKTSSDTYQYPFGYIFGTSSYTGGTAVTQYYYGSSTSSTTSTTYYIPTTLKSVTVTGGNILYGAFYGCSMLTSITIPASVTSIGSSAFYNCASLTSINIPDSVTSIGSYAFSGCNKLTNIYYGGDVEGWLSISGLSPLMSYGSSSKNLYFNNVLVTEITVPDSVTSIGSEAFSYCTSLESIAIPDSVTSIGSEAFYHTAYYNNENNWENGVLYIDKHLIAAKTSLSGAYEIKSDTLTIADSAFESCTSLTSITIPDSVTSIGSYAFSGCSSLQSITLPFVGGSASATSASASTLFGYIFGTSSYTGGTAVEQHCSSYLFRIYYIPTTLKSVTITGGNLLYGAFYGCSMLTDITIGDGVTSIGTYAFRGCTSLTGIAIPDSVTSIGSYAFYNCTSLTSITIGSGVTSIGSYAFSGCTSLKSITIPNGVTSIGSYAFSGCTKLTSVTIPDSVTSIGYRAFYNCDSLNYTEYDNACYLGNTANPYIVLIKARDTSITSCEINENTKMIYSEAFKGCTSLKSVTIGSGVTSIESYAFWGCASLTGITIPDGVTSIGEYAFEDCYSLTSITIPDSVTSIGNVAFRSCTSLTGVYITDIAAWCKISFENSIANPLYYAHNLYLDGTLVTELTIPDGVTTIPSSAFYGCSALTSITIPDGVTSIGQYAFSDCASLKSVTIGSGVTSIGSYAFHNCTSLIEIYNLSSLTITAGSSNNGYVAYYAKNVYTATEGESKLTTTNDGYIFYDDTANWNGYYLMGYTGNETSLALPESFKGNNYSIYQSAFASCTSLTSITIPDGVTTIPSYAFYGCSALTSITIPDSVNTIPSYAFYGCSMLTDITLPDSVTSIGSYAFYNCTSLTSITIPDSVTSIGNYAFSGCTCEIKWGDNPTITEIGNYAFSGYQGTSITIPNGVTSIGNDAFRDCTALTEINYNATECADLSSNNYVFAYAGQSGDGITVNIGADVTKIPAYLFYPYSDSSYSPKIVSVVFAGNSICTSIGDCAFDSCTLLTSIEIPDNVTSIGDYAFYGCTKLTSVTIGNGVTSIGSYAFYNCTSLTSITIPDSVTSIGNYAFYGCTKLTSIDIPDSVTSIGNYAFYGCTKLTSITIPDSVTSIGSYAFYNCTGLTSIIVSSGNTVYHSDGNCLIETASKTLVLGCNTSVIPSDGSVTSIGSNAFYNCTSLTSITIPNSVTSIGSSAFSGCTALTEINYNATECADLSSGNGVFHNAGKNGEGITVTIGANVTKIPAYLFCPYYSSYSPKIVNVVFKENSVCTSIGSSAFGGCSSLQSITLPFVGGSASATSASSSTLFGYIFGTSSYTGGTAVKQYYSSSSYKTYYIPTTLKSVTITGGNILYGAFDGCSMLTSVTIGDGVASIGSNAFYGCTKLTSVTIGSGVTSIGSYTFYNCTGLTSIIVSSGNTVYHSDGNCLIETASKTLVLGCNTSVIPSDGSVTSIGSNAFYNCASLTGITIPDGVTSIGEYAFEDCYSLTSITIPDSVKSIGSSAFRGCTALNSVTIGSGVTSIGERAFYGCKSLTSITIPNGVTSIGDWAFYNCTSLTEINYNATACEDLSDSNYVFYKAGQSGDGITVTIGANVTKIPAYLFYPYSSSSYFPKIVSVVFEYGSVCESIGESAFEDCTSLTNIEIPAGVTSIGSHAFYGCTSLTSVTIGNGVTSIGNYAFYYCTKLTEINYNATACGELSSGNYVFAYAGQDGKGITVNIGADVTKIPAYLFYPYKDSSYTPKIVSVIFEDGSVCESIGSYAFSGCTSLTGVYITDIAAWCKISFGDSTANPLYYAHNLYLNNVLVTELTIPESVTSIGNYAFYNCTSLESVTIGNGVTSIGYWAFSGCTCEIKWGDNSTITEIGNYAFSYYKGTSITIPNSVTSIGSRAFDNCTSLTSITIPNSVTSIGIYAFYNCTSLESVTIGEGVTSIEYGAFYGCKSLTSVTFENTSGWRVYTSSTATSGTSISSDDLTNTSTAATYLKSNYQYYYWKRS